MKALSIRHPFVAAILAGCKSIDVRAYRTVHRGDLLIHASAVFGRQEKAELERLRRLGVELGAPEPGQRGALVGIARLTACRPMSAGDWEAALVEPRAGEWWAWELEGAEAFPSPIPYRGHLFMWDVPDTEFEAALAAAPAP